MPTVMRFLVLLALLLAPSLSAQTWRPVPPPGSLPYATQITGIHPDTVLMLRQLPFGSLSSVLRSVDGARTWESVDLGVTFYEGLTFNQGLALNEEYDLVSLGGSGWAIGGADPTGASHLLISPDQGATWTERELATGGGVRCVQPFGADSLVVAQIERIEPRSYGWRYFVGAQSGGPWRAISGLRRSAIDCEVGPDEILYSVIYGPAQQQIERSADRGATWDTLTVTAPQGGSTQISSVLALGRDTLLAVSFRNVLRSVDGGASWESRLRVDTRSVANGVQLSIGTDGRLVGVTPFLRRLDDGSFQPTVYVSADRGASWSGIDGDALRFRSHLSPPTASAAFSRAPDDLLVGMNSFGDTVCLTKTTGPDNQFLVGHQSSFGRLFRGALDDLSPDDGAPVGFKGFSALPTLSGRLGVVVGIENGGIRRGSLSCGFGWGRGYPESPSTPVLAALDESGRGVVLSDSAGQRVLSPSPTFVGGEANLSTWRDLTYEGRYLAVSERAVWTSTDGAEWTYRATLPPSNTSSPVGIAGTSTGVVVTYRDTAPMRLDGDRWTTVSGDESISEFRGIERSRGEYRAWGEGGVIVSTDDAVNWSPLGSGLDNETVYSLLSLGDGRYLVGTASGVWELRDSLGVWTRLDSGIDTDTFGPVLGLQVFATSSFEYEDIIPAYYQVIAYTEQQAYIGFDLGTNFTDAPVVTKTALTLGSPSPTPSAQGVRFDVSTPTSATLEAYDLLGRRVWQSDLQPGTHSAEWDGNGADGGRVSAGVYLIVLRTESETRTTHAVLL